MIILEHGHIKRGHQDKISQPVQDEQDPNLWVLNGSFKMNERGDDGEDDQDNLGCAETGLCLHGSLSEKLDFACRF